MTVKVNLDLAKKVLRVVDKGLSSGLGVPIPGQMCVEAAVAFASDEVHNENPSCVHAALASEKISLNDCEGWKSSKLRARGLRRVAIAQLGSVGKFNHNKFQDLLNGKLEKELFLFEKTEVMKEITTGVAAFLKKAKKAKNRTDLCQLEYRFEVETDEWGDPVEGKHYSTDDADSQAVWHVEALRILHPKWKIEKCLFETAEAMVQVLKKMKIPGTKYLHLTEGKKRKTANRKKRL